MAGSALPASTSFLTFIMSSVQLVRAYPCRVYQLGVSYNKGFHKLKQIPSNFDWRANGKVSPVKNQNRCNACWAFSVIANIESHRLIQLNQNQILSEQYLIDCLPNSNGCGNTSLIKTFAHIVTDLGGVLQEDDYYPYAEEKEACRHGTRDAALIPVIGFRRVYSDEDVMVQYLYLYGPLTAAINSKSMETYTNGIDEPTDDSCSPSHLNHAVLIVGYSAYIAPDTGKTTPYWIIKNSWGTKWGDNGFYYLVRGRNACGIASDVSFAFVK
ncbi:cathepsin F-like [Battus philenor]|uniref:cathepsin F-like n=1 Tax=Battus philenor TaxID=42288 RepID=UPI0035D0B1F2